MNTQIIVPSSGTIDLYQDVPISLNYSISDIRKPETRQAYWSKTITLPGTDTNNQMFQQIFEVGIERQFNPNKKADVRIQADTSTVMTGTMQLLKIRVFDKTKLEYEVAIKGKLSNIFTAMGDKKLSDINLSTWNHTYNKANIKTSWSAPVGTGYVYPFIDYGYSPNGIDYDVSHFFPAVYLKEYIDQIFQITGFQYSSTFFTSNLFKRLIIPFNSDRVKLSASTIAARHIKAGRSTTNYSTGNFSAATQVDKIQFNDNTTPPFEDSSSQYSTTNFYATIANTGRYDVSAVIYPRFNVTVAATTTMQLGIAIRLVIEDAAGNKQVIANGGVNRVHNIADGTGLFTANSNNSPTTINLSSANVLIPSGYKVYVEYAYSKQGTGTITANPVTLINSFMEVKVNSTLGIQEGDTMDMNSCLPKDIKMRDLFSSVIKCFNLFLETDERTPNKLIIETRNTYYAGSSSQPAVRTLDWTNKLDHSHPFEITPMGELDAKQYEFTYDDDDDYYNKLHKSRYDFAYGRRLIDVDNDFITEKKVIKPIFASTPLAGDSSSNRIISQIFSIDNTGARSPKASKLRLLYYGGLMTSNPSWNFTSTSSTPTIETQFAYAGHLDDPYSPTVDLCFGVPREVYYPTSGGITYGNNNLYNNYWKQHIEEITDKNSSIVTGYFLLKPTDILTLDFRNKIFIDGIIYRLNRIDDYNPLKNSVTKCELIKAKDIPVFVSRLTQIYNGTASQTVGNSSAKTIGEDDSETMPITGWALGTGTGNPSNQPTVNARSGNTIIGVRNYVDITAERILISGIQNSVGANCRDITINNSSGCIVNGGLYNVSIVNSSGVTVTESNITYNNNIIVNAVTGGVKQITASDEVDKGEQMVLADASVGNISYVLPSAVTNVGRELIVKKIDSSANTVTINTTGGQKIDGISSQTLTDQWSVFTFKSNGSNWFEI